MDIQQFRGIVESDKKALAYLESICAVIGGNVCPRCGYDKVYYIEAKKRKRCSSCGYRFTLYSRRWFNEAHIPAASWLWIVKLFEMELTATRISAETGISYPTTLKAVTAIRKSIAATTPHGISFMRHPDTERDNPVYYSEENDDGQVKVQLLADRIKVLERLEHGHLICTDRSVRQDRLICDGIFHGSADNGHGRPRFRFFLAYSFGERRFITERLQKYHGVNDNLLPLYVLEMEYRLKNRGKRLFRPLVENLCRFIPPELKTSDKSTGPEPRDREYQA